VSNSIPRIERIFRDALGVAVDSPETDLIETGVLDSMGLVTLLFELEREFSVTISLNVELESLRTIEGLAALVDAATENGGA
jgi:acyl carrier protein